MDGILNLNKPTGPTSHDCVSRVRRVLQTRRVGHAGTLDPLASGVLVIGVGIGTRILEYLQGLPKIYRATLRLGVETSTQDITGEVLTRADASGVTEAAFRDTAAGFRGNIQQIPPMVSALKVGGKKLYELARAGETVERQPRPVTIYRLEVLGFTPGTEAEAELRVECSAGTYIRTLSHDIGAVLGTGAAMTTLEREAVGGLRVEDAVPLDQLSPETPLVSPAEALAHIPAFTADAEAQRRLAQGQFIPAPPEVPDGPIRVLDEAGQLIAMAVARGHGEARLLAPEKVFITV